MSEQSSAKELLYRVARFGLVETEQLLATGEPGRSLVSHITSERMTGIACAARADGMLHLEPAMDERLLKRHQSAMVLALKLERKLLEVSRSLEQARIDHIVLKGPALARSIYPSPEWRAFRDVDLLVRSGDFAATSDVLSKMSFARRLAEPRRGFSERFAKAAAFRHPSGIEFDLHRTLAAGPFGLWLDAGELFDHTSRFSLGDGSLKRLSDTALLLHACVHATLGWQPPQLQPVRDVAQVALMGAIDWDLLADWTRRWRLGAVMAHAFTTTTSLLQIDLPPEVRVHELTKAGRREGRALLAYTTERRHRGAAAIATLRAIPGLGGKVSYAGALLFPSREFLEARVRGRHARIERLAVPLRQLLGLGSFKKGKRS